MIYPMSYVCSTTLVLVGAAARISEERQRFDVNRYLRERSDFYGEEVPHQLKLAIPSSSTADSDDEQVDLVASPFAAMD